MEDDSRRPPRDSGSAHGGRGVTAEEADSLPRKRGDSGGAHRGEMTERGYPEVKAVVGV